MAQRVDGSIEVGAPVEKVYEYWKDLENLPNFMSNIEEVRTNAGDVSHWKIRGPLGKTVEFDAKTTQNERNEAIAWNSTGGEVETSGQVRFESVTPNRTRLEVQMNYADPPGGKLGEAASRLTSGPKAILEQDLKNFKDIMEGNASPEEVQQRPAMADAHSGAVAFLTSGAGLATIGGIALLYLLLRPNNKDRSLSGGRRGIRFTVEL